MAQASLSIALPIGTVRYTDSGSGPALVFVHGVFVNGTLWRKVVPRLERHFRCIVPTLPLGAHDVPMNAAAGVSPHGVAQLIADFLAALDLHDVTLVGNDTGGALCQLVVAHHPERVARLVLTNCDSFENFPPALLRPLYRCARLPGIFGLLAQLFRAPFLQRAFFRTVAHRVPEPAVLAALFRPLRASADVRRDIAAFFAALRGDELLLAAPSFARFAGTVLVAWGTNDLFFPLRDARRLAAAFAGATCIEIADSRTFVSEDQPMVLAESIERFVGAPAAA